MDIDSLKAFIHVAQSKSFSAAAEKLFLTQPAVSKRIAALETTVNAKLFDRINRQVVLTEAGQALLPRASEILASIDNARRTLNELSGEVRGELRVATSHHVGLHKLPPVLRSFAARYPEVNLKFEFLDSEIAFSRVARGGCELAIVTLGETDSHELETEKIWDDPLCFVSQASDEKLEYTLEELCSLPAILPDLSTFTGRIIKRSFDQRNLSLTVSMYTNYLETIKMLVSVGLGWSVLPKSMLDQQLKTLSVEDLRLSRDLGIIRHPQRTLSNAASAFYQLIKEYAP